LWGLIGSAQALSIADNNIVPDLSLLPDALWRVLRRGQFSVSGGQFSATEVRWGDHQRATECLKVELWHGEHIKLFGAVV